MGKFVADFFLGHPVDLHSSAPNIGHNAEYSLYAFPVAENNCLFLLWLLFVVIVSGSKIPPSQSVCQHVRRHVE